MVNTYRVLVRRDTYTTTPCIVAEHEIKILQEIHGAGNILTEDEKSVLDGLPKPLGTFTPPADEYQRLCNKYGKEMVAYAIGKEEDLKKILNPRPSRGAKAATE